MLWPLSRHGVALCVSPLRDSETRFFENDRFRTWHILISSPQNVYLPVTHVFIDSIV
jgi:hypothetical protein